VYSCHVTLCAATESTQLPLPFLNPDKNCVTDDPARCRRPRGCCWRRRARCGSVERGAALPSPPARAARTAISMSALAARTPHHPHVSSCCSHISHPPCFLPSPIRYHRAIASSSLALPSIMPDPRASSTIIVAVRVRRCRVALCAAFCRHTSGPGRNIAAWSGRPGVSWCGSCARWLPSPGSLLSVPSNTAQCFSPADSSAGASRQHCCVGQSKCVE